jgi:hypothetical protein
MVGIDTSYQRLILLLSAQQILQGLLQVAESRPNLLASLSFTCIDAELKKLKQVFGVGLNDAVLLF